tara:strand:+ start:11226 stop:11732 length:507 start_codon:yes stop_codon:yes gene_type:complete
MSFAVGDKVLFKKDKMEGQVVKINSAYKITVLADNGFEISVSVRDLVKIEPGTDEAVSYGKFFYSKDIDSKAVKLQVEKEIKKVLTIDLHIELLSSDYKSLDNFEIIQIQLNECHNRIRDALNSQATRLDIIHGIGEGVLKDAVHTVLESYNLRFFLTNDGGLTEVYL